MDPQRRTLRKEKEFDEKHDPLRLLLERDAKDAYTRQWHRLERGLRLNRIRLFVDELAVTYEMTKKEKDDVFQYLQRALDRRLLNTLKVVQYDQVSQKIEQIRGFEIKREDSGELKYELGAPKKKEATRKRKIKLEEKEDQETEA